MGLCPIRCQKPEVFEFSVSRRFDERHVRIGMLMQNPNIPEDWKQTIRDYIPKDEREAAEKAEILTLIDREGERLLLRDCAYAHMTASSIIVNGARTKTLMAFHKIYQSWAWTGGHADGEGDLLSVALREAREETGVEHIRPLSPAIASLDILPVWGHVKRGKWVPSHQHLNVSYLLVADESDALQIREGENSRVGWLPAERLLEYTNEWQMDGVYAKLLARARELLRNA